MIWLPCLWVIPKNIYCKGAIGAWLPPSLISSYFHRICWKDCSLDSWKAEVASFTGYGEIIFSLISCQTVLHVQNQGTFVSRWDQDAVQIFNVTASLSQPLCTLPAEGQVTEIMLEHVNSSAKESILVGSLNALVVLDISSCFLSKHRDAFWWNWKYHCETMLLTSSCRLLCLSLLCNYWLRVYK